MLPIYTVLVCRECVSGLVGFVCIAMSAPACGNSALYTAKTDASVTMGGHLHVRILFIKSDCGRSTRLIFSLNQLIEHSEVAVRCSILFTSHVHVVFVGLAIYIVIDNGVFV